MRNRRTIQYALDLDSGVVVSRVGSEIAWPVLDFVGIGQGGRGFEPGDFNGPTRFNLERMPVRSVGREWETLRWTRKVPLKVKQLHRAFWGLPVRVLVDCGELTQAQIDKPWGKARRKEAKA